MIDVMWFMVFCDGGIGGSEEDINKDRVEQEAKWWYLGVQWGNDQDNSVNFIYLFVYFFKKVFTIQCVGGTCMLGNWFIL